jgi:hypothetical protein
MNQGDFLRMYIQKKVFTSFIYDFKCISGNVGNSAKEFINGRLVIALKNWNWIDFAEQLYDTIQELLYDFFILFLN